LQECETITDKARTLLIWLSERKLTMQKPQQNPYEDYHNVAGSDDLAKKEGIPYQIFVLLWEKRHECGR